MQCLGVGVLQCMTLSKGPRKVGSRGSDFVSGLSRIIFGMCVYIRRFNRGGRLVAMLPPFCVQMFINKLDFVALQ